MRYNSSGFFEEKLSFLGLGGSDFPTDENGLPDREKCSALFHKAFESGVTFFFVPAAAGTEKEALFGENLSSLNRNEYFLSGGISADSIYKGEDPAKTFSEQLIRLKNGYFDYYIIENIGGENFSYFVEKNIYDIFRRLKDSGKIRHLGFSFSGTGEEWDFLLKKYSWDFVKMDFNFYKWDHLGADKLYRDIRKMGIPFIASDPFMGGLILDPPEEVLDILRRGEPMYSMEEWALRWFFDKKGLLCIIADSSSEEQFAQYTDIISSSKTLNSQKKHYLKAASEAL